MSGDMCAAASDAASGSASQVEGFKRGELDFTRSHDPLRACSVPLGARSRGRTVPRQKLAIPAHVPPAARLGDTAIICPLPHAISSRLAGAG